MKRIILKNSSLFAAAAMAALVAVPAHAGSVTQPGETIGFAPGAPLPPGVYLADTSDYGQVGKTSIGVTIPVLVWSTPVMFLGARVQLLGAAPLVEASTPGSHVQGWYNPWFAAQMAWDLGNGVGVSYLLGVYPKVSGPVANQSDTINQRGAISYTANGLNLSANIIYGTESDTHTVPDYLNADLTATMSHGNWSFGPVGYASTDTSSPYGGYRKQSQFAVGGLLGYNFGGIVMQTYLTHVVAQSNYGANDTRFWLRFIIPMGL
jgi:hypothetical protein